MDGSNEREADALALKAYELFMATHLEPDHPKARARLIGGHFLLWTSTWLR